MKQFCLYVPGEPVAKARPRVGKGGRVYTPRKTQVHESKIREEWLENYEDEPTKNPVKISMTFYLTKPKKIPKDFPDTPQKRPDIDNLIKTVLDALNGLAYEDDKQIVKVSARKEWSNRPHGIGYTYIELWEV